MISIVACCHGAKLCTYAARDYQSQQYCWRWVRRINSGQLLSFIINKLHEVCRGHRKFLKPLHTSETINNTGSSKLFPWVKVTEPVSPNNSKHLLWFFVWQITGKLILIFLRCCNCSSKKLTSGKQRWEQKKLLVLPSK